MKPWDRSPRSVLLACDFSQTSKRTFDASVRLARALDATLHILHVNEENAVFAGHSSAEAVHFLDDIARRRVEWIARYQAVAHAMGVAAVSLMREGPPAETILAEAERIDATVLAIGSQGAHGLGNMLPGSVARKVLRRSQRPTLVVSRMAGVSSSDEGTFEKILYPTDFSDASRRGLETAELLVDRTGAELALLNVVRMPHTIPAYADEPSPMIPRSLVASMLAEAEAALRALSAERDHAEVSAQAVVYSDPADGIAEAASQGGVDLIVMPRHSSHGAGAFFFGSTAERLVKIAPVPVLLFSPVAASA